jgi:hypothetical protein
VNFTKHQRIDHPTKSKYPAYSNNCDLLQEDSRGILEDSRKLAPDLDLDLDQGAGIKEQGSGKGSKPKASALARLSWLPSWIPEEAWKGWLEVRKKKHCPDTDRAMRLVVKKLGQLRAAGEDIGAVLDQSTVSGWTKLYPVSIDRTAQQAKRGSVESHNVNVALGILKREEAKNGK